MPVKRSVGCAVLLFALLVNLSVAHQLKRNREALAETPTVAAGEVPFVSAQMYEIPVGWACRQCIGQRTYALLFYDPAAEQPLRPEECRAFVWQAVREGEYVLLDARSNPGLTHHVIGLDGGRAEDRVLFSMNWERLASIEIRTGNTVSILETDPNEPVVTILPSSAYIDFYDEQGRFLHGILPRTGQDQNKDG